MPHSLPLIVVRHGQTDWNTAQRLQGSIDISLNDHGRWQAAQAASALADVPIRAMYSSDLSRAHDTAKALAQQVGIPVTLHTGLRERHFGDFEGLTYAEVADQHPHEHAQWRARAPHFAPPHGESLVDLHTRIERTVFEIVQTQLQSSLQNASPIAQDGAVVVFTHGGVLDIIYRIATGMPIDAMRTWDIHNAAINRFMATHNKLHLLAWGDVAHLER